MQPARLCHLLGRSWSGARPFLPRTELHRVLSLSLSSGPRPRDPQAPRSSPPPTSVEPTRAPILSEWVLRALKVAIPVLTAGITLGGVALEYESAKEERRQQQQVERVQAERARLDLQRNELEKCIDKIALYRGRGESGAGGDNETVHRISALGAAIRLRRFFDPESELGGAGRVDIIDSKRQKAKGKMEATYSARAPEGPHKPPYDKKTAPFAKDVANFISAVTRMTKREYKEKKAAMLEEKRNGAPRWFALHKLLVDGLAYAPGGTLIGHDFQYTDLSHAYLGFPPSERPLDISKADFFRANLSGASFKAAICKNTVFHSAICDDSTVFHETNLAGANFKKAICLGTWFGKAKLTDASFEKAVLDKAGFNEAALTGVSFKGAEITECRFEDANLRGADFTKATIKGCNFMKADIRGCKFGTTNIDEVSSWTEAIYDENTRFPDGFAKDGKGLNKVPSRALRNPSQHN